MITTAQSLNQIDTRPSLAPIVVSETLTLRETRPTDLGLLNLYMSDQRVAERCLNLPHPLPPGTVETLLERVAAHDSTTRLWVMDSSAAGGTEVAGALSVKVLSVSQGEIEFWVAPHLRDQDVAQTALNAWITNNPLQLYTLYAEILQTNPIAARVLTACGFAYMGDAEAFSVARQARLPSWTYSRNLA